MLYVTAHFETANALQDFLRVLDDVRARGVSLHEVQPLHFAPTVLVRMEGEHDRDRVAELAREAGARVSTRTLVLSQALQLEKEENPLFSEPPPHHPTSGSRKCGH